MRVLTVKQPWAWAIVHGGKDVENRSRNIAGAYRGPVAIHAALVQAEESDPVWDWPLYRQSHDAASAQVRHRVDVRGAIVGVVDLVDVHPPVPGEGGIRGDTCSPWAEPGCWHLELVRPRALSKLIPLRGALGLRRLPAEVAAQIEGQVA